MIWGKVSRSNIYGQAVVNNNDGVVDGVYLPSAIEPSRVVAIIIGLSDLDHSTINVFDDTF